MANDLRWQIVDQVIVLGTASEISDLLRRAERRKERIARCHYPMAGKTELLSDFLNSRVTLDFAQTPLRDVIDFLGDYSSISFGQALDCVLLPIGLDWEVFDEVLAFGTSSALIEFAGRQRRRHELIARFRQSGSPRARQIAEKLGDLVAFNFTKTPLGDGTDFIAERAGLDLLVVGTHVDAHGRTAIPLRDKPVVLIE